MIRGHQCGRHQSVQEDGVNGALTELLHGLRCLLERQTRQGWSLMRVREQVLKVAATLTVHARRVTVHLGAAADKWWPTLLRGLPQLAPLE